MSDQDLPTYLRGHSLSQADQASSQGAALLDLCRAATADGRFSPDELTALRQWLADADFATMPAARYLRTIVEKVIADGKITPEEYQQVYRAVESILPIDARLQAMAARKEAEAADESAARATGAGSRGGLAGFSRSAAARAGLIVAILAALAALWFNG